MVSADQQTLHEVEQWLADGRRVWLATVMQTWALSPRPIGSLLAFNDQDQWAGAAGDGSLEAVLLRQAEKDHSGDKPVQVHHVVTPADQKHFHFSGDGEVLLLVEPLQGESALENVRTICQRLDERQRVTRSVGHDGMTILDSSAVPAGVEVEHHQVLHTLLPVFRLLLVGAGEVAGFIAAQAHEAGFEVSLCEPRSSFRRQGDESVAPLLTDTPETLIPAAFSDRYCAILALAQEPSVDDRTVMAALEGEAFFVGALGDSRVCAERRQRLHEQGVEDRVMARLHAPVGFEIGSRTPVEIAVASLAQLISERYRLFLRPSARR